MVLIIHVHSRIIKYWLKNIIRFFFVFINLEIWKHLNIFKSVSDYIIVRSTWMGRPNWSQIIKQIGLKQALLRARSRARFTVPKEQGRRSHAREMAAQFL
jgi:hypothetical protein